MGVLSTSTSSIITFSDDCHNDNTDDDDDIDDIDNNFSSHFERLFGQIFKIHEKNLNRGLWNNTMVKRLEQVEGS